MLVWSLSAVGVLSAVGRFRTTPWMLRALTPLGCHALGGVPTFLWPTPPHVKRHVERLEKKKREKRKKIVFRG